MTDTTKIEHQAESHRAHVSQLLDELRERATPGEVLDQLLGWEDGREMARTFGRQVRDNPLPLTLIGAGIAWLMAGDAIHGRRAVVAYADRSNASVHADLDGTGRSVVANARDAASDLTESARSAIGQARQTASDAAAGVSQAASSTWQRASGAAQNSADAVRQAGSNLNSVARDQPLLVAGIGMALGMALGAVLPVSDTENELFGDRADALKAKAGDLAAQGYEQAKAVVERSYEAAADAASDEMQKQGLAAASPGNETEATALPENGREGDGNGSTYGSSAYPHH